MNIFEVAAYQMSPVRGISPEEKQIAEPYLRDPSLGTLKALLKHHFTNVQDQGKMHDIKARIDLARELHPLPLCVKDVYAFLRIETRYGMVDMFARNGMSRSTPNHLQTFMVDWMFHTSQNLEVKKDKGFQRSRAVLSDLHARNPMQNLSCLDLRNQSQNDPSCLRGLNPKSRELIRAKSFCPNNVAGCTEEILLTWRPYALTLLMNKYGSNATSQNHIRVENIEFSSGSDEGLVTYHIKMPGAWQRFQEKITPQYGSSIEIVNQELDTEVPPCVRCKDDIIAQQINLVGIQHLSRHGKKLNKIDAEDVDSIVDMMNHGIMVYYAEAFDTPPKQRSYTVFSA